ncbi:MAG TPA: class I SAM-dependent methyltransferase [Clostridia bacterium]|nr:class I SAM-dependent methyltransferase [Clostridia bacterium]
MSPKDKDFNVFGPIEKIVVFQQKLREDTLLREKNFSGLRVFKNELLAEGQSSVFYSPYNFSYFLSLYEIAARYIKKSFGGKKNIKVLEIGCGTGWGSYFLAGEFPDIYFLATNINARSIQYAAEVYRRKNLGYRVLNGLRQDLPGESFDMVFFMEVLEHFKEEDQKNLLRQSLSSLKKGGIILFSTPSREFSFGLPTPGWGCHKKEFDSREELLNWLDDFKREENFSGIEVNRLTAGGRYLWGQRIMTLVLNPFLHLSHRLKIKVTKSSIFGKIAGSRKLLSPKEEGLPDLDLRFLPGSTAGISRRTIALIGLITK